MPAKSTTTKKTGAAGASPAKAAARKAAKPFTSGDAYECRVCGLSVVIDEECDCVDACEIICCEKPMQPRKKTTTARKAAAKPAKPKASKAA